MLRIVFDREDLARIRIAERPDALWETVLSVHQLCDRGARAETHRQWASWVGLSASPAALHSARVLNELAPARRYFPDFLTPAETSAGLDAGIETILTTPRQRLRTEIGRMATTRRPSPWLTDLARGAPKRLNWLGAAIRTYRKAALAPFDERVGAQIDAHRAAAAARMSRYGVDGLLRGLAAGIRWTPPVLSADYPADLDVELAGRGLTLVPSVFCRGMPVTLADADLDPVLVYPVDLSHDWTQPPERRLGVDQHLAALIGSPRAALLRALSRPMSTTQLSRRCGMSMSSTSEHVTILRNAGLVASKRDGRHVRHSMTPLGQNVLAGATTT